MASDSSGARRHGTLQYGHFYDGTIRALTLFRRAYLGDAPVVDRAEPHHQFGSSCPTPPSRRGSCAAKRLRLSPRMVRLGSIDKLVHHRDTRAGKRQRPDGAVVKMAVLEGGRARRAARCCPKP